jgi:hypothetical protein
MKRYVTICVAATLTILMCVGSVNAWFDPFVRLGLNTGAVYSSTERDAKPHMIGRYPHNAVLLGSSKMAYVDPDQISAHGYRFFNAAISGGRPEEFLNFVERYVHSEKLIVLEVDLFMMNEAATAFPRRAETFRQGTFRQEFARLLDYLLSWRVGLKSYESWKLEAHHSYAPYLKASGGRNAVEDLKASNALSAPDYAHALDVLKLGAYGNFKYSEQRVEDLRRLRKILDDRGITCVAIMPPTNTHVRDLINSLPEARSALDRFRSDMKLVFPDIIDYSTQYSEDKYYFRHDPFHFLPVTGASFVVDALTRHGDTRR